MKKVIDCNTLMDFHLQCTLHSGPDWNRFVQKTQKVKVAWISQNQTVFKSIWYRAFRNMSTFCFQLHQEAEFRVKRCRNCHFVQNVWFLCSNYIDLFQCCHQISKKKQIIPIFSHHGHYAEAFYAEILM